MIKIKNLCDAKKLKIFVMQKKIKNLCDAKN
jgi:hypothetical protein